MAQDQPGDGFYPDLHQRIGVYLEALHAAGVQEQDVDIGILADFDPAAESVFIANVERIDAIAGRGQRRWGAQTAPGASTHRAWVFWFAGEHVTLEVTGAVSLARKQKWLDLARGDVDSEAELRKKKAEEAEARRVAHEAEVAAYYQAQKQTHGGGRSEE